MATLTVHHGRDQYNCCLIREKIETRRGQKGLVQIMQLGSERGRIRTQRSPRLLHCDIQTPFSRGKLTEPLSGTIPSRPV